MELRDFLQVKIYIISPLSGFPHPPCVQPVRHHYRRSIRSTYLELNARLDAIKSDERIRQGHENIERRADFIEW